MIHFSSLLLLFAFFDSGVVMAVEEPEFKVEAKKYSYEVRKYQEIIVAETQVNASFEESGNIAFRILADYISDSNKTKAKIEMTVPVSQLKSTGGYLIQFMMPKKFTMETLPEPNDARVHLRKILARRIAVYSYSGRWAEQRFLEKLQVFNSELKKDKIQTIGEPVFSRYNSPFMPWFLRRNEIWLEMKAD